MQISELLEALGDSLVWASAGPGELPEDLMLDFVRADTVYHPDTIYIGPWAEVCPFLAQLSPNAGLPLVVCTRCTAGERCPQHAAPFGLAGVCLDEVSVYRILSHTLRRTQNGTQDAPGQSRNLALLYSDLFSGGIRSQTIWESRSAILHSRYPKSELKWPTYHVLYIDIPAEPGPALPRLPLLVQRLSGLLPFWNIAEWDGKIVGLLLEKDICLLSQTDAGPLSSFLSAYGLYGAVIGLSVRYYRIKTLLQMAAQGIRVGKILYARDDVHLFYPGRDFNSYMMIDLFRRAFRSTVKHNDVGYYISFPIMALIRYDKHYQTNLRTVLYTYISTNCSLAQTAETLGLHKNTITNKLKKIERIVQCDLTDPELQFELRLSFRILHYFELCADLPAEARPADIPGDAFIL